MQAANNNNHHPGVPMNLLEEQMNGISLEEQNIMKAMAASA